MTVTIHPNGKIDGINNTNFDGSLSAGHVVQTVFVNYLNNNSSLVTEITSTNYTDIGINIDITPKFANSILIFETDLNCALNDSDGHSMWDVYDATNGRYFSSNDGGSAGHYGAGTGHYISQHIRIKGAALNTSAMQLRLRALVRSGGTCLLYTSDAADD